jgi:hypothetical protein
MSQGKMNQDKTILRWNGKHPGSHSKKSYTTIETKFPEIVKSSLSADTPKMETLYTLNKGSPKVIKSNEDSENSKSKSSFKKSFWWSPDSSSGIEKLFITMNLCDSSKSFFTSINICNIKNMIHLSNLELNELSSLFSRKELGKSSFQDTIIKVLCLGKSFFT